MYNKQEKTAIRDSVVVVDIEISMKKKVILENILKFIYSDELYKYKLNINFSNVLFLTDSWDSNPIQVTIDGKDHYIETLNILRMQDGVINTDLLQTHRISKSVIILGCINRIDPELVKQVMISFNSHIIVLYGDSALALDSEYDNIYSIYFTNIKCDITENFDTESFDVSKKKIYNVLSKIRKNVEHEKISRSNVFSVETSDTIDTAEIIEFIDEDYDSVIVVPELYYTKLNSNIRYYKSGDMNLIPKVGETLHNVHPLVLSTVGKKNNFIPAFSNIVVCGHTDDIDLHVENGRIICYLDVTIDGELYPSAPFDFGFFISNFDMELHPEHEDQYIILNNLYANIEDGKIKKTFSNKELKCVPYNVVKPMHIKYGKFSKIRAYSLLYDTSSVSSLINTTLYNSICTATDKVELIEGKKFEIV